jgi:hypothetical protein
MLYKAPLDFLISIASSDGRVSGLSMESGAAARKAQAHLRLSWADQ